MRCTVPPLDTFMVASPSGGASRYVVGREQVNMRPGVLVRCPTGVPFRELARFVRSKARAQAALSADGEGGEPAALALVAAVSLPPADLDPSSADRAAPEAT